MADMKIMPRLYSSHRRLCEKFDMHIQERTYANAHIPGKTQQHLRTDTLLHSSEITRMVGGKPEDYL